MGFDSRCQFGLRSHEKFVLQERAAEGYADNHGRLCCHQIRCESGLNWFKLVWIGWLAFDLPPEILSGGWCGILWSGWSKGLATVWGGWPRFEVAGSSGLNHFKPVWTNSNQFKPVQIGFNWFKLAWPCSDWFKLVWTGSNWFWNGFKLV